MSESPSRLVKRALAVLGITQAQLAPLVSRSQQAMSRMVRGETCDPLVVEKIDWLMARHGALTTIEVQAPKQIAWCKRSDDMDPSAFLDHLPWCDDCQAAVLKSAGYVG